MKSNKSKSPAGKNKPATPAKSTLTKPVVQHQTVIPPLFRKIDWFALLISFAVVGIIYFLTLAPEQTLEDSGELCTGAFYAGIPHPPGYPFWTVYAWLWTKLLAWGD